MTRVLALGGLTIDWLETALGRSGPALGGNAAYAAVGAWLAGSAAEVVAVVGDDYPAELLDQLTSSGIGVESVRVSPGPSFRVLLDESGDQRVISYLPGSGHNDRLDPIPSQLSALTSADAAHLCAIPTGSQRALLSELDGMVGTVTLDTVVIRGEIEPTAGDLLDLGRRVDAFLPSREEVQQHWPGRLDRALEELHRSGVRRIVVKMGPDGSLGRDERGTLSVPTVRVEVVDPTGAGDAYCGAFCAHLAAGADLRDAMIWGAAAASVVIEDHGAAHALTDSGRERAAQRAARLREILKAAV
jgi:sugar/nucleoside kinase (ribokinase family)